MNLGIKFAIVLQEEGLVNVDGDNHITLTDAGKSVAERIYDRHNVLSEFFMMLGVRKDQALEDACKIEHDLSDETYTLLKAHYLKLANNK